ncbi:uncharacterized protein LOC143022614 isoform X3 [Oratosquilla oratoria]|uniref:uncharacterized protein LOC143022614 isoform X3 n=1 Tax=Oratosquilla oratoria TaxID=337810 RepID=UPI003F761EE2
MEQPAPDFSRMYYLIRILILCVATIPPTSSSITPTDSNGEVASQASKCSIKPGIDYKSAPELPVAISFLQYMESGFGSLKHAIEDDSHI